MELSADTVAKIQAEVAQSMAAAGDVEILGNISADSIGQNKAQILAFLNILVGLLPGVIGKLAGQAIIVAANAWFNNKGY
ncbi:hypothetical protein D9M71_728360 [compost metagenome]